MTRRPHLPAAALALAGLIGACSETGDNTAAAQTAPVAPIGPIPAAARADDPQPARTYANACAPCHANRGFGVQALADRIGADRASIHERNTLDAETIRTVVRSGIGAMPAMSKGEVSDAELDRIIVQLLQVREGAARP